MVVLTLECCSCMQHTTQVPTMQDSGWSSLGHCFSWPVAGGELVSLQAPIGMSGRSAAVTALHSRILLPIPLHLPVFIHLDYLPYFIALGYHNLSFLSAAMSLTWPWHFVTVSPDEKQQRRELLTLRGYYAQGSVLLVIAIIRLYQIYSERTKSADKPNNRRTRKPKSWLESPPFAGWAESRKHYIISFLWLIWLVSLSIWNTGDGKYSRLLLYWIPSGA